VQARVAPDAAFLEALTEPGALHTAADGGWHERLVLPAASGASTQDLRLRLFGSVALLHALVETLSADGAVQAQRSTEVYRWNGTAWRLVGSQLTPARTAAARLPVSGVAPAHTAWAGSDPVGEPDTVLRQLNDSYVKAFREADVAWYGAHLAPGYLVISGDGSLHDRGAALTDFAKPTFATHIRSFPVDRVTVRRFEHVALIQAENAYEMKDGRKGINRYTDIWVQDGSAWRCVAAHITVFRPPA
jgi:ketosteroid isomerase-like protein